MTEPNIPAEEALQDQIEAGDPPIDAGDASLRREMMTQSDEPLLLVEKQLIVGSLILGIALLGILVWASTTFFPTAK
ncbi:MAG TPA: hypothetical protein VHR72_11865 [Gemmataceae bacterium]|jgi:hypothetical protein|nr:hypothetical protein [Gemmataceae bacterium]